MRLLILFFLMASQQFIVAQTLYAHLNGVVLNNETKEAVNFAYVHVLNKDGDTVRIVHSGRDGKFTVNGVREGNYTLKIINGAFESYVIENFTLPQKKKCVVYLNPLPIPEKGDSINYIVHPTTTILYHSSEYNVPPK